MEEPREGTDGYSLEEKDLSGAPCPSLKGQQQTDGHTGAREGTTNGSEYAAGVPKTMEDDDDEENRHRMSNWLRLWLSALRRYYLFAHFFYIVLVAFYAALACYFSEKVGFLDALVEAVSCVSNTGIATVNISEWGTTSKVFRHLAMVCGGMVFTSAFTPIIRLFMLRRLKKETRIDEEDIPSLKMWKKRKQMFIERLETTSIISASLTFIYFGVVQFIGFFILAVRLRNDPRVTPGSIAGSVVGAFQNYGGREIPWSDDVFGVVVISSMGSAGSGLFPVLFRYFCHGMRRSILMQRLIRKKWKKFRANRKKRNGPLLENDSSSSSSDDDGDAFNPGEMGMTTVGGGRLYVKKAECQQPSEKQEEEDNANGGELYRDEWQIVDDDDILGGVVHERPRQGSIGSRVSRAVRNPAGQKGGLGVFDGPKKHRTIRDMAAVPHIVHYDNYWDSERYKYRSRWEKGINTILHTEDPSIFHPLLFNLSDTHYLLLAFIMITAFQMTPMLFQEWSGGGVLAVYSPVGRFFIAMSSAMLIRFTGMTVVDTTLLSNVNIAWIMFAMYIPVIPIPNLDRSKKKWKQMVSAGVMRLMTSRLFLIFMSMSIIVWIEEDRVYPLIKDTPFDVSTRSLFEVVSCYATSGVSLPATSVPNSSFSNVFQPVSKLVLIICMLVGRHRWMEVGLDVGLNELEKSEREVEALLLGKFDEGSQAPFSARGSQAPQTHGTRSRGASTYQSKPE